jgi:hypothetical protein
MVLLGGRPNCVLLLEYVYQLIPPIGYGQSIITHTHDMRCHRLLVQAIDFADFLRTQYLLKSPTGKSRE